MAAKPPRRTAQRILETARLLFNRFGVPNVSTTSIAAELGISPGNLHYHFPSKNDLLDALVADDLQALAKMLATAPAVRRVEQAWEHVQAQFALAHGHRFLLRDLNELLSRNRQLERQVQALLGQQTEAARALLQGLVAGGEARMSPTEIEDLTTTMVLVLSGWHSFAYARAPRQALEDAQAERTLNEGVGQVLTLVAPYLVPEARARLAQRRRAGEGPAGRPCPRPALATG